MRFELITDDQSLAECIEAHRNQDLVAMDTEFRRRDTFYPQPALLQVCWDEIAFLIDPLTIDDPGPVIDLMTSPGVMKLIHSPSEDLEVFDYWLGVLPAPLFDTQRALAFLGQGFGVGYRAIVELYRGLQLDKDETQSNWLQRPLTDTQLTYAMQDVTHLRGIGEEIVAACDALERRDWVLEDTAKIKPGGRGPLSKFKSAWKLSAIEQQVIVDLVSWRESEAQRLDKPRSWILPDKVISAIAKAKPAYLGALAKIEGLHDAVLRRRGKTILGIVETSLDKLPGQPHFQPPILGDQRALVPPLLEQVQTTAKSLNIAPEVLMSKAELEQLIQVWLGARADTPSCVTGWRESVLIEPLRSTFQRLVQSESQA